MSKVIEDLIEREGPPTNDPVDMGGRTQLGISEAANPEAWADGKVTKDEAYAIYTAKYVKFPKFDVVPDEALKIQLIDFGVTSGPQLAIQKLQAILGVTEDGILGPITLKALSLVDPRWVNNALVSARVLMICRLVQKRPAQLRFLAGWCSRACEFIT